MPASRLEYRCAQTPTGAQRHLLLKQLVWLLLGAFFALLAVHCLHSTPDDLCIFLKWSKSCGRSIQTLCYEAAAERCYNDLAAQPCPQPIG